MDSETPYWTCLRFLLHCEEDQSIVEKLCLCESLKCRWKQHIWGSNTDWASQCLHPCLCVSALVLLQWSPSLQGNKNACTFCISFVGLWLFLCPDSASSHKNKYMYMYKVDLSSSWAGSVCTVAGSWICVPRCAGTWACKALLHLVIQTVVHTHTHPPRPGGRLLCSHSWPT